MLSFVDCDLNFITKGSIRIFLEIDNFILCHAPSNVASDVFVFERLAIDFLTFHVVLLIHEFHAHANDIISVCLARPSQFRCIGCSVSECCG